MAENGTKPEFEVYDTGHLYNLAYLIQAGFIKPPVYLQFVTGILGGIGSTPYDLINLHTTADRLIGQGNYLWSAFGAGRAEFPFCTQALLLGGNVRVGMEDNLMLNRKHISCIMGHVQRYEVAIDYDANGKRLTGLFSGCYYQHKEDYRDAQSNAATWHGIHMLYGVRNGEFTHNSVELSYLRDRFKGK